jgi:hypothetical protein
MIEQQNPQKESLQQALATSQLETLPLPPDREKLEQPELPS